MQARLGLPVEKVVFCRGDSALAYATPAGGSAQTASITAAMRPPSKPRQGDAESCGQQLAAGGQREQDVEAQDEGLFRKDDGDGEHYAAILFRANRGHIDCEGAPSMPFELRHAMHSYGAHFARCG
ncbi:MAG: hypothetical protein KF735_15165 [Chelatococcus sp.]|uniref:hypothetical protein n=1 Tax=Chelatococcus sp. TaxID=1953771 RepID=UPI0025B9F159|nr:hypothetical protein [Chelatococcus sp.]MBX3538984.1 hypothetical protein [Chelatococcus sp.]